MSFMQAMQKPRRRVFGWFEVGFDLLYLGFGLVLGIYMLATFSGGARLLAGSMAIVLAGGDAFHLVPRVMAVLSGDDQRLRRALGFGKLVTSITMTAFYVILWHLRLLFTSNAPAASWTYVLYAIAAIRALLCLPRGNQWFAERPPVSWGVYRNIPFALMGTMVAWLFAARVEIPGMGYMPLAIALSFLFYLPVVLFSNRNPKIGMLMMPKTLMYVWIIVLCAKAISK